VKAIWITVYPKRGRSYTEGVTGDFFLANPDRALVEELERENQSSPAATPAVAEAAG